MTAEKTLEGADTKGNPINMALELAYLRSENLRNHHILKEYVKIVQQMREKREKREKKKKKEEKKKRRKEKEERYLM